MNSGARWWADDGFVGGAEVLPFSVLVLVIGSLLVANSWAVVNADLAIDLAAREANRSIVESDSIDQAAIEATARRVAGGLGLDADRVEVTVERTGNGSALVRCERVSVVVAYDVPAVGLPGRRNLPVSVVGRHSEVVDPFRSSPVLQDGQCA